MDKLKVCALGTAIGLTWGLGLLFASLVSMIANGWGEPFIHVIASVYLGYDASLSGALIGFLWGFLDGFIGGAIVAFIYNKTVYCCAKKSG